MVLSMTGYGKVVANYNEKKIHIEVKSLNSKSLDISTRIAPLYREKEMEMRQMIAAVLERGKIDFSIWIEKETGVDAVPINGTLIEHYYQQLKEISQRTGIPEPSNWYATLLRLPDVTTRTDIEELDDAEWAIATKGIEEALKQLMDFRRQEGLALQAKFSQNLEHIEQYLAQIETFERQRIEKIRQRISESLQQIPEVEYDKNRFEQELIYYIEKLDINEEKQRLKNHLDYFRQTMNEPASQGKKLGFIAQEMGREINTTGSKSNQAEMQNLVVMMKDELEQIKEQVLNVL